MPARALDHVVVPCRDLAAAARACAALGFTVGRRNRHPWGTENHLMQFASSFVELVSLADNFHSPVPADDAFPFAGFLAGEGASRDPSGMIVLRSTGAEADAAAFQAAGIGSGRTLHFSRDGAAPDGTTRTVAFTLAFAEAPAMPDVGFFVCQQHYPENFWNPALQRHANGATGIVAVVVEASEPRDHGGFLARFAGADDLAADGDRLRVDLGDDAAIEVVRRGGLVSPRLAGLRFRGTAAMPGVVPLAALGAGGGIAGRGTA